MNVLEVGGKHQKAALKLRADSPEKKVTGKARETDSRPGKLGRASDFLKYVHAKLK